MTPILECRNLCFSYHSAEGETEALRDISFTVFPGTFTAIVGPSGCGKSTLLSLICGLIPPERGEIISDNTHIGYMLQRDHLLEWRTVYENAILGLEMQHQCTEDNLRFVRQMLTDYGLADFADAKPSSLSGGMRQRAALIRTMAIHPKLLLLDEPFSALDYQTRLEVADDIGSLIVQSGKNSHPGHARSVRGHQPRGSGDRPDTASCQDPLHSAAGFRGGAGRQTSHLAGAA